MPFYYGVQLQYQNIFKIFNSTADILEGKPKNILLVYALINIVALDWAKCPAKLIPETTKPLLHINIFKDTLLQFIDYAC